MPDPPAAAGGGGGIPISAPTANSGGRRPHSSRASAAGSSLPLPQSSSLDGLSSSLPRTSSSRASPLGGSLSSSSLHNGVSASAGASPNSAGPVREREPVRIAADLYYNATVPASQVQQAQQQQFAQLLLSMPPPPASAVQQHRSPSASAMLSPPSGAPPTERTRLLLDGGTFSTHNDMVDADDLEDDELLHQGFIGRGSLTLYGSGLLSNGVSKSNSSTASGCASPSPPLDSDDDSAQPPPPAVMAKNSRAYVMFILPVTIMLCVANSVTWKRTLNRFASVDGSQRNLEFFVNQWTLVLFTLIAGAILAYRWFFTTLITEEMRRFPRARFATMGGLDAVAGLFAVVGGALSAGQVQIVVQQANIPITMLLSRLYLKVSSYAWSQYVGASIIVLGGLLSAFGAGGAAGGGPLGDGGGVSAHVVWFGPVLILIGIIPGSMSNVYKEENFKTHNLDIYFLTTYVAVWQTALSFLCVPLFTLSYFGGIPLDEMPQNLVDGWHCFMGRSLSGYLCDDPSPSTGVLLLLYVVVNFAFNMALLSMVKHGSALALVVAVAVALPITNLMFTQRWAMGTDVEALSLYNLLGIVLVVVGFLLYSLLPNGGTMPVATVADMERGGVAGAAERAAAGGAVGPTGEMMAPVNMFEQLCREFVVPTGPSGHSMHITEYLPSVLDGFASIVGQQPPARERRHSFDFHSSPSVRDVQQARKKRLEKVIGNKTPSRTP